MMGALRGLKKSTDKKRYMLRKAGNIMFILGWIWLIFHLLWGFNYYRQDIGYQFNIDKKKFKISELEQLAQYFLSETNRYGEGRKNGPYSIESSSKILQHAYDSLAVRHPHLKFVSPSFKTSSFGVLGNYMGYGGYYNPLTGEAQVNDLQPAFFLPFTGAHEIAHQLGYAKESEANFIGYLASIYSADSSLKYAANLEMFLYANNALHRKDSVAANLYFDCLSPIAKQDLKTYRAYIEKYQGPVDKITSAFYTQFLKINNQPEGMGSYSRVIVWLFNYLKSEKAF